MTATISHRQNPTSIASRRWLQIVTLLVAVAAIVVAVAAFVASNDSQATPLPRPAVTAQNASVPNFECTPRIAFSRC